MNVLLKTQLFDAWLTNLRDVRAQARIARRIERAAEGNFGDHRNVGGAVWEMRVDCGPGYRLYYARKQETLYILLCGGDKASQPGDIALAKELWRKING